MHIIIAKKLADLLETPEDLLGMLYDLEREAVIRTRKTDDGIEVLLGTAREGFFMAVSGTEDETITATATSLAEALRAVIHQVLDDPNRNLC